MDALADPRRSQGVSDLDNFANELREFSDESELP